MKKNIILGIIIALLVIAVAVEGFFIWKQNDDKNKEEEKAQAEQVVETPSVEPSKEPVELPKDEILDGENLKISKKYSNSKGNELVYTYLTVTVEDKLNYNPEYDEDYWKYVYKIPQINIDSENVDKINKEILKKYEDIIDEMNDEQYINLECEGLSYEYYENDGILSLVMVSPTESGGYFKCETYNIDISKKEEIDNTELLEKIDIAEEDLSKKINKAIENLTMYNEDIVEGDFEKEIQDLTINKYKNVLADEVTLYLNNKGNLCAYLEVYGVAGGEFTTLIVDLETNEEIKMK